MELQFQFEKNVILEIIHGTLDAMRKGRGMLSPRSSGSSADSYSNLPNDADELSSFIELISEKWMIAKAMEGDMKNGNTSNPYHDNGKNAAADKKRNDSSERSAEKRSSAVIPITHTMGIKMMFEEIDFIIDEILEFKKKHENDDTPTQNDNDENMSSRVNDKMRCVQSQKRHHKDIFPSQRKRKLEPGSQKRNQKGDEEGVTIEESESKGGNPIASRLKSHTTGTKKLFNDFDIRPEGTSLLQLDTTSTGTDHGIHLESYKSRSIKYRRPRNDNKAPLAMMSLSEANQNLTQRHAQSAGSGNDDEQANENTALVQSPSTKKSSARSPAMKPRGRPPKRGRNSNMKKKNQVPVHDLLIPDKKNLRQQQSKQPQAPPDAALPQNTELDAESARVLASIPLKVKEDFKQIGFTMYVGRYQPILQVGPFDIAAELVRKQWFEMCEVKRKLNKPLHRLVYWYGSEVENAFSFIPANRIVSYDNGVKRGLDKIPPKLQRKLEGNKPLNGTEKIIVNGLSDMVADAMLPPEQRAKWLLPSDDDSNIANEEYAEYEEDGDYDDGEEDEPSDEDDASAYDDDESKTSSDDNNILDNPNVSLRVTSPAASKSKGTRKRRVVNSPATKTRNSKRRTEEEGEVEAPSFDFRVSLKPKKSEVGTSKSPRYQVYGLKVCKEEEVLLEEEVEIEKVVDKKLQKIIHYENVHLNLTFNLEM